MKVDRAQDFESRLWALLEKEKLADLSQYHAPGLLDEVPLYSRESDVGFLPADKARANHLLLRFSLKFLKAVIAYEQHPSGYFAAITVSDFSDARIVPNLFVCCRELGKLKKSLELSPVASPFGMRVQRLVQALKLPEPFASLEDRSTDPEAARVFISPARPPYEGFAPLAALV